VSTVKRVSRKFVLTDLNWVSGDKKFLQGFSKLTKRPNPSSVKLQTHPSLKKRVNLELMCKIALAGLSILKELINSRFAESITCSDKFDDRAKRKGISKPITGKSSWFSPKNLS
jgi:hypothetical protein